MKMAVTSFLFVMSSNLQQGMADRSFVNKKVEE